MQFVTNNFATQTYKHIKNNFRNSSLLLLVYLHIYYVYVNKTIKNLWWNHWNGKELNGVVNECYWVVYMHAHWGNSLFPFMIQNFAVSSFHNAFFTIQKIVDDFHYCYIFYVLCIYELWAISPEPSNRLVPWRFVDLLVAVTPNKRGFLENRRLSLLPPPWSSSSFSLLLSSPAASSANLTRVGKCGL